MRTLALGWALLAGSAVVMASVAAKANVYDFDFTTISGPDFTVTGQVTTSNSLDLVGGYDILSITGQVIGPGGGTITGLEPNPNQPNQSTSSNGLWFFDNVAFKSSPYVDNNGVLFDAGGSEYNIYSTGPSTYFLSTNNSNGVYNPGELGLSLLPFPSPRRGR